MTLTRENLNPCTVQLTIACDKAEVDDGFAKALRDVAKKMKLPGFRPGHAPAHIVEKYVTRESLAEDAIEHIVQKAYKSALEQEKIEPDRSVRPYVKLEKIDPEAGACDFTVKVPLPPVVEIGEYKGIELEKPKIEVTDEEVQYQIEELRKQRATREPITDRGIMEGDVAVVNIRVEGEAGDGRNFMTVAGQTFPGLDALLLGMKVEDMKQATLDFPDKFQEKDWAGKSLPCQVGVNSVSSVRPPALDDAFAQSLKTENLDDLKTRIRDGVARAKEAMVMEMVTEQLMDKLLEKSHVEVADPMWEAIADRRLRDTEVEQHKAGKTLEEYAKENGMTLEELREAWRDRSRMHVKRALLIREVRDREKLLITNEDLNRELHSMASEYEVTPEEMLNLLKANQSLEDLHFRALSRKVTEYLYEHAKVRELEGAANS